MKKTQSIRLRYFWGFIILIFLMTFVYFLQYHGLIPCPLCILQRIMMIALSVIFFLGVLQPFKKTGNVVIGLMSLVVSFTGMLLAARQAWLQHTPPPGQGGCGVSLSYLLNILPVTEVIKLVWQGGTECSELGWVFLGLSLAEWSLMTFGLLFIFIILQLKRSFQA